MDSDDIKGLIGALMILCAFGLLIFAMVWSITHPSMMVITTEMRIVETSQCFIDGEEISCDDERFDRFERDDDD